jgi:hypothetical protein
MLSNSRRSILSRFIRAVRYFSGDCAHPRRFRRLLFTLNADMESSVSESVLQTLFDTIWPDFAARIHSLVEAADDQRSSALQASDSEKLNFLIEELESLKRRISKVEERV